MAMVSCRGLAIAIKVLMARGQSVEPLIEGLPLSLETVSNPASSIRWEELIEIMARTETLVGGPDAFISFVADMTEEPLMRPLTRMLSLAVSPAQLYKVVFGWFGESLYPTHKTQQKEHPDGRIEIVLEIGKEHAGSLAFMRCAQGAMVGAPRVLDLPPPRIEAKLTPHRGEFLIDVPLSRSVPSRMKRIYNIWTSSEAAIDELVAQRREIVDSYQKLREREAELKRQIEERKRAEGIARDLDRQLQQAQKMDALGRFAGGIAHDFNNLLTVVLAEAHELKTIPQSPDAVAEAAEHIAHAAETAAQLTRQLLAFGQKKYRSVSAHRSEPGLERHGVDAPPARRRDGGGRAQARSSDRRRSSRFTLHRADHRQPGCQRAGRDARGWHHPGEHNATIPTLRDQDHGLRQRTWHARVGSSAGL